MQCNGKCVRLMQVWCHLDERDSRCGGGFGLLGRLMDLCIEAMAVQVPNRRFVLGYLGRNLSLELRSGMRTLNVCGRVLDGPRGV